MSEGRGVVNYDTNKPSYGYSTHTTQFDDELMKRGIVDFEQAMMAKGASPEEARRLALLKQTAEGESRRPTTIANREEVRTDRNNVKGMESKNEKIVQDKDGSDDDDDNDGEAEFLKEYRRKRLQELKTKSRFGSVIPIGRADWTQQVNNEKPGVWVIIVLTSSDVERTGCTDIAVQKLADRLPQHKFISIPSKSAIPNWPDHNLPTIFVYRDGVLQHQLVQLPVLLTAAQLQRKFLALGVVHQEEIDETLDDDDDDDDDDEADDQNDRTNRQSHQYRTAASHLNRGYNSSGFGGIGATLQTRETYDGTDADDWDDVD